MLALVLEEGALGKACRPWDLDGVRNPLVPVSLQFETDLQTYPRCQSCGSQRGSFWVSFGFSSDGHPATYKHLVTEKSGKER